MEKRISGKQEIHPSNRRELCSLALASEEIVYFVFILDGRQSVCLLHAVYHSVLYMIY